MLLHEFQKSALFVACKHGYEEIAKSLLSHKEIDINYKCIDNQIISLRYEIIC